MRQLSTTETNKLDNLLRLVQQGLPEEDVRYATYEASDKGELRMKPQGGTARRTFAYCSVLPTGLVRAARRNPTKTKYLLDAQGTTERVAAEIIQAVKQGIV